MPTILERQELERRAAQANELSNLELRKERVEAVVLLVHNGLINAAEARGLLGLPSKRMEEVRGSDNVTQ